MVWQINWVFFESLEVYDFSGDSQQEFCLYELNNDCFAMSKLSLQEGQIEPLENYDGKFGTIPIVVSSSMSTRYNMGQSYTLSYVNGETYEFEEIQVKVAGVLKPSQRFWRGGSTWLSENIADSKDFILAPQFMNFQKDITYSMNSLLQLSGSEVEKEEKLEQLRNIFAKNQLEMQYTTLQEEVDSYYEAQKVLMAGALIFAGVLLLLSLLGCIGAILTEITTRYHEFGIYYAMGTTKADIIVLIQGEILVLFCFSLIIASGGSTLLWSFLLTSISISVNWRVFLSAFAVMLICVMLCAGMPFIKLRKMEPIDMIKGERR